MADADVDWKGDLQLAPDGDLRVVEGEDETRQCILRRLFTSVRGYVWHPSYGAGIPDRIGKPAQERAIQAIVRSQIALEASVAPVPVPTIRVDKIGANPGLFVIAINYTNLATGEPVAMTLDVPGRA